MLLTNLQFFNAGHCVQNEYFTGTGTYRWRKFYAVFVSFVHPVFGRCVIDTGYGPAFLNATKRTVFGWLMRHLLYTPANQPVFQRDFLNTLAIDPAQVSHVFVSHYHADHIGGLSQFPTSRIVCRPEPLRWLQSQTAWRKLNNGFLPQLIPLDLSARLAPVEESQFSVVAAFDTSISSLDYFGDGSVVMMDLPGHAIGHTGYVLNTDQGRIGYIVDAFWDANAFKRNRPLPLPARRVQHDVRQYQQTLEQLREFQQRSEIPILACHCNVTQKYVENPN